MGSICTSGTSVEKKKDVTSWSSSSEEEKMKGGSAVTPRKPQDQPLLDKDIEDRDTHRKKRETQLRFVETERERRVPDQEVRVDPAALLGDDEQMGEFATEEQDRAARSTWKLKRVVGRGSFGEVYLAVNTDGEAAAVKVLSFQSEDPKFQRRMQLLERELTIMRGLAAHPNVVRFLTARCRGNKVFIFMEYCDKGTLRQLYLRRKGGLGLQEGQVYLNAIVNGLVHLHDNNIAHRDLKCENVFLNSRGEAKLGDFGASIVLGDYMQSSFIGSVHWMAPEVVLRQGHKTEADIWSLGCTVMEMFTATHPFQQFPAVKSVIAFLSSTDPVIFDTSNLPRVVCDFIVFCLKRAPEERPKSFQLLDHPLLSSELEGSQFHLSFQSTTGAAATSMSFGRYPHLSQLSPENLDKLCAQSGAPPLHPTS